MNVKRSKLYSELKIIREYDVVICYYILEDVDNFTYIEVKIIAKNDIKEELVKRYKTVKEPNNLRDLDWR